MGGACGGGGWLWLTRNRGAHLVLVGGKMEGWMKTGLEMVGMMEVGIGVVFAMKTDVPGLFRRS